MGFTRTMGLAGISLALLATQVRAGDGDDAAAWLRKGSAAESIDHDVAKALEHYRQALAAPGATLAGLAAGLRLVQLLEAAGDAKGALAAARELAQRFAPVMDEATKERVLDSLGRLLPPGQKERTPLGLVVVPGPAPATADVEPSPLVRRFEDAFRELSLNDPRSADYTRLRGDLLDRLRPLGADALPVLEWMIRSENLRKSTDAMQLLTSGFPTQSVDLLERLARDSDVLVRGPALSALLRLQGTPAKWAALDRLRRVPSLTSQASVLRSRLEAEMPEEALLAQHALGGPEAASWLRIALHKGAEPALRRALEVGEKDRSLVRDGLVSLSAGGRYASASADARGRLEAFLRADPEVDRNVEIRQGLAALAAAHVNDVPEADASGRLAARRAAWARIAEMASPEEVVGAMRALALAQVLAPADLFTDARWTAAFVSGWTTMAVRDGEGDLGQLVEPGALARAGPFWTELAARLSADATAAPKLLDLALEPAKGKVPSGLRDARWVAIAARDVPRQDVELVSSDFLVTAAALSRDPSFVTLYRRAVAEGGRRLLDGLTGALPGYDGPELLDLLVELVGREEPEPESSLSLASRWQQLLTSRAAALLDAPQLLARIRIERAARPRAAAVLVSVLGDRRGQPEILSLLQEEAAREGPRGLAYTAALVHLAESSLSAASYPLLLRLYRENGYAPAADAMNSIREYLARVKTFEGWMHQAEDVGTEVESSLSSADPAVRIAGVQAIVVLERRVAVARLLKMIRTETDASVLGEAKSMLRTLSKAILEGSTAAPNPAEGPSHFKALEFGPDGKPIPPGGRAPPAPGAPPAPADPAAPDGPLPGK